MGKDTKQKKESKTSKDDKKKMSKEEKERNKILAKEEKKRSKEEKKRMKDDKKKSKSSTNLVKEDKKKDKKEKKDKSKKGSEQGKSKSSKDTAKYEKIETEQNIGGPKRSSSYPFLPTRFELPRGQKGYVFPATPGPARYPVTRINYPIMKARRQVDLTKKMVAGPSPPAYTMGIRHTEFREFYNKIQ